MYISQIREGMTVKTAATLGSTMGFLIHSRHINARRTDAVGKLRSWVPGHGGDVWWVEHADGQVAAYAYDEFDEFSPDNNPAPEVEAGNS